MRGRISLDIATKWWQRHSTSLLDVSTHACYLLPSPLFPALVRTPTSPQAATRAPSTTRLPPVCEISKTTLLLRRMKHDTAAAGRPSGNGRR